MLEKTDEKMKHYKTPCATYYSHDGRQLKVKNQAEHSYKTNNSRSSSKSKLELALIRSFSKEQKLPLQKFPRFSTASLDYLKRQNHRIQSMFSSATQ